MTFKDDCARHRTDVGAWIVRWLSSRDRAPVRLWVEYEQQNHVLQWLSGAVWLFPGESFTFNVALPVIEGTYYWMVEGPSDAVATHVDGERLPAVLRSGSAAPCPARLCVRVERQTGS